MKLTHNLIITFLLISYCVGLIANVLGNDGETHSRCKFQEYRCSDGLACLVTEKLCNGVRDCSSGEDETDCSKIHLNTDCGDQLKFFKCRFGGCVPRNLVCNSVVDCKGGSDEASDLCGNSGLKPAPNVIPTGDNTVSKSSGNGKPKPTISSTRPRLPTVHTSTTIRPRPTTVLTTIRPRPTTVLTTIRPRRPIITEPPRIKPQEVDEPDPSSFSPNPKSRICEGLEEEEGVNIKCRIRQKEIGCQGSMPNGTLATYECKSHYSATQNAPRTSRRMCKNGIWTKKNQKWHCNPDCGKGGSESAQFIFNGVTSAIGKWPWHVGLYHQDPPNSGKWVNFCGGTLVSTKMILTAAHCVTTRNGQTKKDIKLYFGKYYRDVNNNDDQVQERIPIDIKVNPYYNSQTFASDIATVIIPPLEITDRVQLACLPNDGDLDTGDIGTLVGWGRFADNRYPEELQEAGLPVKSFKECQKAHPSLEALVKADSFCAGFRNGTSPCDGDSGGGLIYKDTSNKWSVYGIVSAGVAKRGGGCDPKYYTVFTRVMKFRDFIDNSLDQSILKK